MRPDQLHQDAVVVDCHNDLAVSLALHHLHPARGSLRNRWIPELRAGGIDVQVTPIYVQPEVPEAALRMTLQMIQRVLDEIDANPADVALCLDGSEIRAAVESRRIAMIIALEGCSQFGQDVELVRTLFRLGVRMIAFTHWGRSPLADGTGEEGTGGRLTQLGVAVHREMDRLGILTDVSHLSAAGVDHVLELATRPVIASHSNARAVRDHHRNIPDEQLRGIAATGGVIGINAHPILVDHEHPTVERFMDHLDHVVSVAGIDHVGLGADFIRDVLDEMYPATAEVLVEGVDERMAVPGLVRPADLPRVTAELVSRGYTEADVRKVLGGNFLRVFDEVLGRPATSPVGSAGGRPAGHVSEPSRR